MLTIAVALPAAYVLGRYRFRGRSVVGALVVVPFVLPTVVVALAFLAILPDGVERGWAPILVAHAFFNVAVVVRIVGTFWASLDPRVSRGGRDARRVAGARASGRSRCRCSRRRSRPRRRSSSSSRSRRSAIVLILGGPRYATIEAEIYNQAVRLFDLRAAAVLSLVQLACVVAAVWVATRLERAARRRPARSAPRARRAPPAAHGARAGWSSRASLGGLALFLGLPLAVLVERSLAVGGGHGLDAYRALGRPTSVAPRRAVGGGRELDRLRGGGDA